MFTCMCARKLMCLMRTSTSIYIFYLFNERTNQASWLFAVEDMSFADDDDDNDGLSDFPTVH